MLTAELDYYLSKTKKALAESVPPPLPVRTKSELNEPVSNEPALTENVAQQDTAREVEIPASEETSISATDTSDETTREPPTLSVSPAGPLSPLADIELPVIQTTFSEKFYISALAAKARAGAALGTFDHTAAVYASLGFVAGMFAWHAVGFWGFVSNVVLKETTAQPVAVASNEQPKQPILNRPVGTSAITTGSISPASEVTAAEAPASQVTDKPGNCIALVRNPDSGAPSIAPCARGTEMRDAGRTRRADRLQNTISRMQDVGSWAKGTGLATVVAEQPAAPAPSATTLTQDDVNLDLSGFSSSKVTPN